jgi:hypothetical protein
VKKHNHKTIPPLLFFRVADIRGHKDNISYAKKTPNKFGARCSESVLSFQYSLNIKILKNNHLGTQTNGQRTKDKIYQ